MQLNKEHKKKRFILNTHTPVYLPTSFLICVEPCFAFTFAISKEVFVTHWVRRLVVAICASSPSSSVLGAELWESHFGGDSWSSSVLVQKDTIYSSSTNNSALCLQLGPSTSMGKDLCGFLLWVQGSQGFAENQVFPALCAEQLSCWRAGILPSALSAGSVQETLLK